MTSAAKPRTWLVFGLASSPSRHSGLWLTPLGTRTRTVRGEQILSIDGFGQDFLRRPHPHSPFDRISQTLENELDRRHHGDHVKSIDIAHMRQPEHFAAQPILSTDNGDIV